MRDLFNAGKLLLLDLASTFFFLIMYLLTKNIPLAVALGIALGFAPMDVRKVVRLIKVNEYKRRQAAVGIRVTPRGFGKDWRYPITSAWSEWDDIAP